MIFHLANVNELPAGPLEYPIGYLCSEKGCGYESVPLKVWLQFIRSLALAMQSWGSYFSLIDNFWFLGLVWGLNDDV